MEIAKKLQLTEKDFIGIHGTELFTKMLNHRYEVLFKDHEEAVLVWQQINDHCRSAWYLERHKTNEERYYVYFSTVEDASIMSVE